MNPRFLVINPHEYLTLLLIHSIARTCYSHTTVRRQQAPTFRSISSPASVTTTLLHKHVPGGVRRLEQLFLAGGRTQDKAGVGVEPQLSTRPKLARQSVRMTYTAINRALCMTPPQVLVPESKDGRAAIAILSLSRPTKSLPTHVRSRSTKSMPTHLRNTTDCFRCSTMLGATDCCR